MKLFMGLDLSLTGTGCVVLDEEGTILSHNLWGEKLTRDASVRDKIERMVYIAEKIVGAAKSALKGLPDDLHDFNTFVGKRSKSRSVAKDFLHVGIENYAFGAKGAQNDLGELQGVIKSQLWLALHVEPVMIASSTGRKAVMGKGNFPKKKILAELVRRGLELRNHDEADAYVIAECLRLSTLKGDDR